MPIKTELKTYQHIHQYIFQDFVKITMSDFYLGIMQVRRNVIWLRDQ